MATIQYENLLSVDIFGVYEMSTDKMYQRTVLDREACKKACFSRTKYGDLESPVLR